MHYCEVNGCENYATIKHDDVWLCDDCYDRIMDAVGEYLDEYGYEETDDFDEIS